MNSSWIWWPPHSRGLPTDCFLLWHHFSMIRLQWSSNWTHLPSLAFFPSSLHNGARAVTLNMQICWCLSFVSLAWLTPSRTSPSATSPQPSLLPDPVSMSFMSYYTPTALHAVCFFICYSLEFQLSISVFYLQV